MSFYRTLSIVLLFVSAVTAKAAPVILDDFESYEVGTELTMFNYWGGTPAGKAVVEKDPANANNKVLHITISNWGNFARFTLPEELAGSSLLANKDRVTFRFRRSASDQNDYKKIQIYQGTTLLYEDDGYPHQGNKNEWQNRSYNFDKSVSPKGTVLALGINSDNSDYYIDDVALYGEWDDYETIETKVEKDFSNQNTSSSYVTHNQSYRILEQGNLVMKTARYTYLTGKLVGNGRLDICSGGERTYLGGSDKYSPDWTAYKGEVHIYPYKEHSSSNGFYGLVWMHNGKTFSPSSAISDLGDGKANSSLLNSRVTLHEGAVLASESGKRGIRIGHLDTEEGSQIYGYYKEKGSNDAYYVVGFSGDDGTLAGRISPMGDMMSMKVGIIKEGLGTYRITGNTNLITGGVYVLRGAVMVNNDAEKAKAGKLPGAVGYQSSSSTTGAFVMKNGVLGGTGNIASQTDLYGVLQPGDNGIGTLTIEDYAKANPTTLILRPASRIECEVKTQAEYDKVAVAGPVMYNHLDQELEVSDKMPRLQIILAEGASLSVGDEFVLLSAKGRKSYEDAEWAMDIIYPDAYTWEVKEIEDADGYRVVAKVTSLEYGGQGGDIIDDEDDKPSTDDGVFDLEEEKKDATPLRKYTDEMGAFIGTAVRMWEIPVDNDNNAKTALMAKEYNAVVCENEMKFDATEPSRNSFSYTEGDRLVNFARRHNMLMRGHALVWHQQVPGWLSSDGKKNDKNWTKEQLMSILKNHITKVVTHWKGKVHEWDVCNEVLEDDQSIIYSNPNGYSIRQESVWTRVCGEEYIDSAFVWAHRADPDAVLILNDYSVESKGYAKTEAFYNLYKRLRKDGIPVHGVGSQTHVDADINYISSVEANVSRFNKDGVTFHFTEVDLKNNNVTEASRLQQAKNYYSLARIAMKYDNCKEFMIWGLSDNLSWIGEQTEPLLFDRNLNKKPNYWGVHAALRQADNKEITGIEDINLDVTGKPIDAHIYNLAGQRVSVMQKGKIYIRNGKKYLAQ